MKLNYQNCPVCNAEKKEYKEVENIPPSKQLPIRTVEEVIFNCGSSVIWDFGEREGELCPEDVRIKKPVNVEIVK